MFLALPLTLQDRFSAIIRTLCMGLAGRAAGPNNFPHPLFVAIHQALAGRIRRFASLLARFRAGTLRPARPRPAAAARPVAAPRAMLLSRRRGWLLPLIPGAVAYASQLSHLFADPEMAEVIAGAPTLGRLLRPLAQMLAIDLPAALQRPAPVRRPRPKPDKPAREKPRSPQPDYTLPSRRPSIVVRGSRLPRLVFGPG